MKIIALIFCLILICVINKLIAQNDTTPNKIIFGIVIGNDLTYDIIEKNKYTTPDNPKYGFRTGFLITKPINSKNDIEAGLLYCYQEKKHNINTAFIFPDMIHPIYGPIYDTNSQYISAYPSLIYNTTKNSSILLCISSIHRIKYKLYISPSMLMYFWISSKYYNSLENISTKYDLTNLNDGDKYINHFKIGYSIRIGFEHQISNFILRYEPNFVWWNCLNFGDYQKKNYFYSIGLNLIVNYKK